MRAIRPAMFMTALATGALVTASCQGPMPPSAAPARSADPGAPAAGSVSAAATATATVPLTVPPGEGGGAFSVRRKLKLPKGWKARVWARVPDARIEDWTPQGDLLVSEPDNGLVVELRPDSHGTARVHTLLRNLTEPQGLAF